MKASVILEGRFWIEPRETGDEEVEKKKGGGGKTKKKTKKAASSKKPELKVSTPATGASSAQASPNVTHTGFSIFRSETVGAETTHLKPIEETKKGGVGWAERRRREAARRAARATEGVAEARRSRA